MNDLLYTHVYIQTLPLSLTDTRKEDNKMITNPDFQHMNRIRHSAICTKHKMPFYQ